MLVKDLLSEQVAAGWLLILSGLVFAGGGMLYWGRVFQKWPAGATRRYIVWERGLVIAAVVVAVLGLTLFERLLEAAGDRLLAPSGMALALIGASVVIFAETFSISQQEWVYAPTVAYVTLTFLAEAVFGASLLRTGLLPAWIGWATILWNLIWLVILPIARPKEMYYPWLHYVAPLVIGIGLLLRG